MKEETVEPQETAMEQVEQMDDQQQAEQVEAAEENQDANEVIENNSKKVMIPLNVAQKLREQKRELELELQWERQRNAPKPEPQDDNSAYESATREELAQSQENTIRMIEERRWIKENPEKFEIINEELPKLLKERPNLAPAINLASNRYEEADLLLNALSPKQRDRLAKSNAPPKKPAPLSPNSVSKAAAINQTVDVMNMNDKEFKEWRRSHKKGR